MENLIVGEILATRKRPNPTIRDEDKEEIKQEIVQTNTATPVADYID